MKTYNERTASILKKAAQKRRKRNAIASGIVCILIVLGLSLIPYDTTPPSTARYTSNEYYSVIEKINQFTYTPPAYKNPLEKFIHTTIKNLQPSGISGDSLDDTGNLFFESSAPGQAQEDIQSAFTDVTDNQVAGIIEGDRFKRSNSHIFYLRDGFLTAYSIAQEDSAQVGSLNIEDADGYILSAYQGEWEIFLSSDFNTLTLISTAFNKERSVNTSVVLVSIDVSDPANMKEITRTYLSGSYLSARMIDNELLVMSNYRVPKKQIDFDNPATFIPLYGSSDHLTPVSAESIVAPEVISNLSYTVVCKLNASTLEPSATGAFLSYSNEVYVSADNIYASRSYRQQNTSLDDSNASISGPLTEITALSYKSGDLTPLGSVSVEGTILNQYSMDEYQNILRVVTTTSANQANLYCIDLATWDIVASVKDFAPENESVRSVRYDKNTAYVCTALNSYITVQDPVYFFDLTDLNNITYKDTGTIDGYSSSLVNFGDVLLGIGYGANLDTLKIEIYQESDTSVEPICSYEVDGCIFSTEYKAYLIDRNQMRLGLGYSHYENNDFKDCYVLLQFDGYRLMELVHVPLDGNHNNQRAVIIDGYLYLFGNNFHVEKL